VRPTDHATNINPLQLGVCDVAQNRALGLDLRISSQSKSMNSCASSLICVASGQRSAAISHGSTATRPAAQLFRRLRRGRLGWWLVVGGLAAGRYDADELLITGPLAVLPVNPSAPCSPLHARDARPNGARP
jgi:hypothetical protein